MKIRFISAIIAIAIFAPLIILGGYPFAIAMCILGMLGYKEIIDLKKSHKEIPNIVKIIGIISLVYLMIGNYGIDNLDFAMSYQRLIFPLIFLLFPTVFYKKDKYNTNDAFYLIGCTYLIGIVFNLLIIIRNINIYLTLYLLSITIVTDSFAYFIGSLIGKHKLSPLISPNKSIEGAIAGAIGGTIIPVIIYSNLIAPLSFKVCLVTFILSTVGQIGDLVFSKIKRENDIKDFSNIMPGHGGILDRLDSFISVTLAYVLLLWLF